MRQALAALARSTEALTRAVARRDEVALATALDTRREAFERLRDALDGEPSEADAEVLARIARLDSVIGEAARLTQENLRAELEEIRRARAAVAGLRQGEGQAEEPPRFVSRRA